LEEMREQFKDMCEKKHKKPTVTRDFRNLKGPTHVYGHLFAIVSALVNSGLGFFYRSSVPWASWAHCAPWGPLCLWEPWALTIEPRKWRCRAAWRFHMLRSFLRAASPLARALLGYQPKGNDKLKGHSGTYGAQGCTLVTRLIRSQAPLFNGATRSAKVWLWLNSLNVGQAT
jgi:hypothetical protein